MNKYLSFTQVANLIAAVGHKRTIIVEGENGIGKTALFHALKRMPQFANHIAVDPIDCTQLSDGSVWMPDLDRENGISRELPNERFGMSKSNQLGVNGSKPVLIMLDEIAKAPQFIKNVLAPIVYERRVGAFHFVEGSVVFAGTNLSVEGLGDSIQSHLRNRLVFVKMRKPTADEWVKWATDVGINPMVIAFVNNEPRVMSSFLDYEKGGMFEGKDLSKDNGFIFNPRSVQIAYASPRSLAAAGDILDSGLGVLDDDTLEAALVGTVGATTAEAMSSFIRFGRDICEYSRVIADPAKAPLSDNPTAQLIQVFQFVSRVADRKEAEAIVKYVWRMRAEMQSIFCNTVATSQRVAMFATINEFGKMLAEHKIFFSTK
jgi:preprotein translocase subunit Sss1